jgi:tetratricopeptide (TPR) repeat protein
MERYDAALSQFEAAIQRDDTFFSAYAELGYTYADMGRIEDAQAMVAELEDEAPELADTLARYIYKTDTPKIMFASATSSFLYTMPMRTPLSSLDSYLASAGASATFKMEFQFDKEMDRESVENRFNWEISRASGSGPGNQYNFGFAIPDTEVMPPAIPDYIYYDARNLRAVVAFSLTQNDTADGFTGFSRVI